MINFEFSNTTEIVFGKGTQEQVGEKIRKYSDCNKVLVVYGSDRIKKNGLFDAVSSSLKQQKLDLKISDEEYKKQVSEIKSGKDTPTVIIKATDDASYMNLIDALDEMQICNIGKYVITDIAEADRFLIKNFDSKGELSQNIADK